MLESGESHKTRRGGTFETHPGLGFKRDSAFRAILINTVALTGDSLRVTRAWICTRRWLLSLIKSRRRVL